MNYDELWIPKPKPHFAQTSDPHLVWRVHSQEDLKHENNMFCESVGRKERLHNEIKQ